MGYKQTKMLRRGSGVQNPRRHLWMLPRPRTDGRAGSEDYAAMSGHVMRRSRSLAEIAVLPTHKSLPPRVTCRF